MELIVLCVLLGIAFGVNGYLFSQLSAEGKRLAAERLNLKERPKSLEASELLHDLTRGRAVIQVTPINPEEIFLRSPR